MSSLRRLGCVSLLITAMCCVSCGDDDDFCIGDQGWLVPLEIGARWTYRTTVRDVETDTTVEVSIHSVEVLRDTLIEGEVWSIVSTTDYAWANRSDGFWNWYEYNYPPTQPYFVAKFPASPGDEYVLGSGAGARYVTVAGINVPVTVPWGTSATYHFESRNAIGELQSESFYTPGIGRVKTVSIYEAHPGLHRSVSELVSFTLPGC